MNRIYIYSTLHLFIDECLGVFQSFTVENNAEMNILAHVFLCTSLRILLEQTSGNGIAEIERMHVFSFMTYGQLSFQVE